MLQVFIGFIPWIIYWALSGPGLWNIAILGALLAAAGIVAFRYVRSRAFKTMELTSVAFFAVHALVTLVIGSPILKTYSPVASNLMLAAMAIGTLAAKNPFTYQYAKESWDKSYWNDPAFININMLITSIWAGIFVINTLLGALAAFVFSAQSPVAWLLLTVIAPNALVVMGIALSAALPKRLLRQGMMQRLKEMDPHGWSAPQFNQKPIAENEHDVIVIGSGVGGLSAAALLAKRGLKVAVFEQHYLPGGYCTSWERRVRPPNTAPGSKERWRYIFDAGVHDFSGLGKRGGVRSLLKLLDIEDAIEWRLNQQEYFIGQTHFITPHNADEFSQLLGQHFPSEAANITRFFAEMRLTYEEMYQDIDTTGGAPRSPNNLDEMLQYPKTHPHAYYWMDKPFTTMLNEFFTDPQLKEVLLTLTAYLSSDPGSLKVMNMAPIFGYYFDGGWYPVGGSQALPNALVSVIEKHGGKVFLREPVQRILVQNNTAVGVELKSGETHRAKAIISNADTHKTFLELVGKQHLPADFAQSIESLKSSTSAFIVFLGMDIVPDIAPITMLHELGIMIPSKVDGSLAPQGHSAVTLLKQIPQSLAGGWDRNAPDYAARKREFADAMIASAEEVIPGLRQHITYQQEGSPQTFARYAWATGGSIYGPAAGQKTQTIKTPIQNLYMTGSGVMGGGVEAVAIAGIHAANEILPAALAG